MKNVPADFSMRKRKLKTGEIVLYPQPHCKACGRELNAANKQKFIDEYGLEAWQRRHSSYGNKEARRRYNREHYRMTQVEKGAPPKHTWKKYEDELEAVRAEKFYIFPFKQWWEGLDTATRARIRLALDDSVVRLIRRVVTVQQVNISMDAVDAVGEAAGDPGLRARLYPK
jgi:hypothetical protein